MALINCPECNKEISDRATSCPHCGYPISSAPLKQSGLYDVVYKGLVDRKEEVKAIGLLMKFVPTLKLSSGNAIINNPPYVIRAGVSKEEAEQIQRAFLPVNGIVDVVPSTKDPSVAAATTEMNTLVCPRCNSTAITIGQRGYSLIWGFIGSSKTKNRCGKCGYAWEP